jgi:hypothetical protein
MKFAIRDDDLNYFYTPQFIEENIKDIWDICPISMSAVPFIKGAWLENTKILEDLGPNNVSKDIIKKIQEDNQIYDISDNQELVSCIKNKIDEKRVYLTIHAIHHRNEDEQLPKFENNFPIGAEFYTDRDLTYDLKNAIEHLEEAFGQKITIFTPPQNIYSKRGLQSIISNNLNMCAYLPSVKNVWDSIGMIGVANYLKLLKFKIENRGKSVPYPYVLKSSAIQIMNHRSLQPGTNIGGLYKDFEFVYSQGGDFVLSTHSYGFNYKMQGSDKTIGEVLKEFLLYAQKKKNVEFVTLDKIFEGENK